MLLRFSWFRDIWWVSWDLRWLLLVDDELGGVAGKSGVPLDVFFEPLFRNVVSVNEGFIIISAGLCGMRSEDAVF